jgi:hypothetical protein
LVHERGHRPTHPDRAEPVVFLTLVEYHLQATGPDNQEPKSYVVESTHFGVLDVGRVVHKAGDHKDGKKANGNIDVEGVAPTEGIGQPAAQRGAEHRSDHDAEAVSSHGHGALCRWKAFEQDRLR